MKTVLTFLVLILYLIPLRSQYCGDFTLTNFADTTVEEAWWDGPLPGFAFDLSYDTLTVLNSFYTSFYLTDLGGDTLTDKKYQQWSRTFPLQSGTTRRYAMAYDSLTGLTSLPADFQGYLLTANPECRIPINLRLGAIDPHGEPDRPLIYPNPTTGRVYLNAPWVEVDVYDLVGRRWLRATRESTLPSVSSWAVDLEALPPAAYLLRWRTRDGTTGAEIVLRR